jgi:hypothetical protein
MLLSRMVSQLSIFRIFLFIFIVYVYLLGAMGGGWELDGLVLTFRS